MLGDSSKEECYRLLLLAENVESGFCHRGIPKFTQCCRESGFPGS